MQIKNKNILVFIDWYLPGTKAGGPVRSLANLTAHLSDEFEFWIVTRNTDYCETTPYPEIQADEWIETAPNIHVFYASKKSQNRKTFRTFISDPFFDQVYINGIYSPKYSILPLQLANKANKKIIVAPRGMLNPQAFSSKKVKKKVFLFLAKAFSLYRNVNLHATNKTEKKYIKKHLGTASKITVASNLHRKTANTVWKQKPKQTGEVKLISIARIAPEKGTLFALKVLSELKPENDEKITFKLFGQVYNEKYWQQCQKVIEQLPEHITVSYEGTAESEKIPELLADSHFLFMPSEGENFGHSILEAFIAGCPVLISDQTPWKNLEQKHLGWDISKKQPERFAEALDKALSMDKKEFSVWSKAAFQFAQQFCNDPKLEDASKKLFLM